MYHVFFVCTYNKLYFFIFFKTKAVWYGVYCVEASPKYMYFV